MTPSFYRIVIRGHNAHVATVAGCKHNAAALDPFTSLRITTITPKAFKHDRRDTHSSGLVQQYARIRRDHLLVDNFARGTLVNEPIC